MKFNQTTCTPEGDESVLDLLLRHGEDVSYSCKSGSCQSCLLKSLKGDISPDAQRGLKETHKSQGYFLACQQPAKSIELACQIDEQALFGSARLIEKHFYNAEICRLRLELSCPLYYHAGQFVNLKNSLGTNRSYSLASLPSEDAFIELHIRRKDRGEMTQWIFEDFKEGDYIDVQGPIGECFYTDTSPHMTLMLIGTGTGAAPLAGICRDAIRSGHKGDIHFYHGGSDTGSLYLHEELKQRANEVTNFFYHPCLSTEAPLEHMYNEYRQGRCNDIALSEMGDPKNTQLYLCGNPQMVTSTSKAAFIAGVSISHIYVDPFEYKDKRKTDR